MFFNECLHIIIMLYFIPVGSGGFFVLELRWLRDHVDQVRERLTTRGLPDSILDEFLEADKQRRALILEAEQRKRERNELNRLIGQKRRAGEDTLEFVQKAEALSSEIQALDERLEFIEKGLEEWLLRLPNLPHPSVPVGKDAQDNVEIRCSGKPIHFAFPPRDHVELGHLLGILDLDRASRIAGARFPLFKGVGARLVRALIEFMLTLHTREHGYQEVWVPYLVNPETMQGTGQLPKFHDDLYYIERDNLYLIPTAEVPVTNLFRGETLREENLPIRLTAYTACFRREAGAYGQESKGLIRQHQFDKVELVQIVQPELSYQSLEELTSHAENVLKRLGLVYRVMGLCTGDLGFAAAKTYDLEAWLPSQQRWLEVSSCSNFEAFQSHRMELRYRPKSGGKSLYPHTLNGSGLAVGRTLVVLLEQYQQKDGTVLIPEALRPYLDGMERLEPQPFPI